LLSKENSQLPIGLRHSLLKNNDTPVDEKNKTLIEIKWCCASMER